MTRFLIGSRFDLRVYKKCHVVIDSSGLGGTYRELCVIKNFIRRYACRQLEALSSQSGGRVTSLCDVPTMHHLSPTALINLHCSLCVSGG